jgi:hypothetical protein
VSSLAALPVAVLVAPVLAYRPFLDPLPYSWNFWPWLLLPLVVGVAVVYKSIKCRTMKQVPREAAGITVWILSGLAGAAGVLVIIVKLIDRSRS